MEKCDRRKQTNQRLNEVCYETYTSETCYTSYRVNFIFVHMYSQLYTQHNIHACIHAHTNCMAGNNAAELSCIPPRTFSILFLSYMLSVFLRHTQKCMLATRVYTRCCVIFYIRINKCIRMYVSNTNIRIVFLRHQNVPDMSYVYATVKSKARITTTTNQK